MRLQERIRVGTVLFRQDDGLWVGYCPALPAAVSGGTSLPECRARLRDAIQTVLLYAPHDDVADLREMQPTRGKAEVVEIDLPRRPATDLVTQAEIARIARVSRQAVSHWATKVKGFPRPSTGSGHGALWERDDILRWLAEGRRSPGRPSAREQLHAPTD
jgi:predicted RNase H-like HicB family nuclease